MLPAVYRMRRGSDFEAAVRRGRRSGRRTLVVHARVSRVGGAPGSQERLQAPRVGFVVARSVGNAVVRNRVKRRLRAAMASRVAALPAGALVVVRANPAAAAADWAMLIADLDAALPKALLLGESR
ncbi:MAG TPA: ribonuclease P protein component [Kineosporiaceae bacterium]